MDSSAAAKFSDVASRLPSRLPPLPLTTTVADLKTNILSPILGDSLPLSKVKLSFGELFLKDSLTLAHYNMDERSVITLGMKERGGRRK
jgi:splicing factor 3A subunit 1